MKSEKRSAVVFGLSALLLIFSEVTFAGQWMVVNTFTDDFNRADVSSTTDIGPGWLVGQNPAVPYLTRWRINSHRLLNHENITATAYATNFMVGSHYDVYMDVQWTNLDVAGWHNTAALCGNIQYSTNPPNATNLNFSVAASYGNGGAGARISIIVNGVYPFLWDNEGSLQAGFVVNEWYRMTLQRSNDQVRASVIGPGINKDSGWLNIPTATPVVATNYVDIAGTTWASWSTPCMSNFSLTTYKWVDKGTIISIR